MSPGHHPEPEEPRGSHARPERALDWAAWRQGPGYSEPVPPDDGDEPAGHRRPPGAHRAPTSYYGQGYGDPPAYPAPADPGDPSAYPAPASSGDPSGYPAPDGHGDPSGYPAPDGHGDPSGYPAPGGYGDPSAYPEAESYDDFEDQDEAEAYEPGDHGDGDGQRASGPYTGISPGERADDDFGGFWTTDQPGKPGRFRLGGRDRRDNRGPASGTHQPPVSERAFPPRDDDAIRRPGRRNAAGFLIVMSAIAVIAAIVAVVLLLRHHGPSHATAGSGRHPSASSGPSSAPRRFGASGHLGIPAQITGLRFNPRLTLRFVGPAIRKQDANSFSVPVSDVVSGFYTANPSASAFTAGDPRIMFITAYLSGTGNIASSLHDFLASHTFYAQHQVGAGSQGGAAACGYLPQQPTPVAHCMWADHNTYTDIYAWNSTPAALARTMTAIRPQIELARPYT